MWQAYYRPTALEAVLRLLAEHGAQARLVAGGTDLLVELQRGIRPTSVVIDIGAVAELKYVQRDGDLLRLGALATHNDVVASADCVRYALPLAQACLEVGAPQIRARGTLAGNLVTASPANDTITPLMALDAELVLASLAGERVVPLRAFYSGVRRTVIRRDELLREIRFAALRDNQRGIFLKLGLRRAQAISVVNLALIIGFDLSTASTLIEAGDSARPAQHPAESERVASTEATSTSRSLELPRVTSASIALGSLAPTIVRAGEAEAYLVGKPLDAATCAAAAVLARNVAAPIDDLRGSADYRLATLEGLVGQGLARIGAGSHSAGFPQRPVLLESAARSALRAAPIAGILERPAHSAQHTVPVFERRDAGVEAASAPLAAINTTINGQAYQLPLAHGKTLLDFLRDDVGLTGTKEGCAEGECGACTVWLNGQAVMACLVPAPQAHGAAITTIEGLAQGGQLHPLQQAFIEHGAVQCGYCIPGMLMAGAKLLDEQPDPDLDQIQAAISGNICRCTGYRKILDAVLAARPGRQD